MKDKLDKTDNIGTGEVKAGDTKTVTGDVVNTAINTAVEANKIKYVSVKSSSSGNKNNDGATGSDSVAIGGGAVATETDTVAVGKEA